MNGKVNVSKIYFYDKEKEWFKTRNGKRGIPLTMSEAVKIITAYKNGVCVKDIYDGMFFKSDSINESSIYNFVQKYDLGLLDKAIKYICQVCGLNAIDYVKNNDCVKSNFRRNTLSAYDSARFVKAISVDSAEDIIEHVDSKVFDFDAVLGPYAKMLGYLDARNLVEDFVIPSLEGMVEDKRNLLLRERDVIDSKLSLLNNK